MSVLVAEGIGDIRQGGYLGSTTDNFMVLLGCRGKGGFGKIKK